MPVEEEMGRNAEITRNFYEAYNRRDWQALASLLAPTVEWFHAGRGERIQGVEAVTALLRGSAEAFPEALVEVRAVHEGGATVTTEWSYTSAREKQPARGTPVAQACDVKEIRDGKLVRGATYGDTLQMLLELETSSAPAWSEDEEEAVDEGVDEAVDEAVDEGVNEAEAEETEAAPASASAPSPGPRRSIIPTAPTAPVIRYRAA